ncbi:MAG: hypothetical protein Q8R28_19825 [Dehalococcoidia bacterium]|nr:hypothetical protein [Dehalococcoidia bacterium]
MKFLLLIIGVVVVAVGVSAALVVTGEAPQCPQAATTAAVKTQSQIGDLLSRDKSVTITDADATAASKGMLGSVMTDPRVCFDAQGAHVSGKFGLGQISFSSYVSLASADLDLSGASPKVSKLDIRLGGLPSIPGVSDQAGTLVASAINQGLAQIKLSKPLKAQFAAGVVTVRE